MVTALPSRKVAGAVRSIWAPDDRIALVPRAGLARMQVDRVTDAETHRTFASVEQARAWLEGD